MLTNMDMEIGDCIGNKLIEVSFSELSCFRRCHQKHNYRYIQQLQKKAKAIPLERGSILHKCLEGLYRTGEWKPEWKAYKKEFKKLFEEEREALGDIPKEVFRLMRGYCNCWKYDKHWDILGIETEFKCRLPHSRVVLKGVIDLIIQDKVGIWPVEHKSHKILPNHDCRMMEVQSTLYYYVVSRKFDNVSGILFNYLRTKAPTEPQLLQSGELSKKKIDTDRATYLSAIKKHELDPKNYEDILERLSYKTFFKRERVSRPNALVEAVVREAILTGHLIEPFREGRLLPARTIISQCAWDCEFQPLCYAELHGHDTDYLINTMYQPREKRGEVLVEKQEEDK